MTMPDPPRRTSFAPGQLVTPESLRVEQEYHRRMRYLHNRVHGHGVAHGLEVGVDVGQGGVRVSPGMAFDASGRELVVTDDRFVDVPDERALADGGMDVVLVWAEVPDLAVPGPDGEELCTGWTEVPRLELCARGRAAPEAVLLARLCRGSDGAISVSTTGRRAVGRDGPGPISVRPERPRWRARVRGALRSLGRRPVV